MNSKNEIYDKLEHIVMEKISCLEEENHHLKTELSVAKAKLEIYERLIGISNSKIQLGFEPPDKQ